MWTVRLSFTVLGRPQPAGSKRAYVHPKTGRAIVTDASPRSKPWKQEVAAAAREAVCREFGEVERPPFQGPVELTVTFFRQRPKGHFGSGRNAGVVKQGADAFPVSKPDATKLLRGVEDALTSVVWRDDAQVVDQHVFKRFGAPERAEVVVRALPASVGEIKE